MIKKCSLCDKETKKFVKSHIFPQALVQYILGQDRNKGLIVHSNLTYLMKSRTGIYFELLCMRCEEIFNIWDDYAVNFFKELEKLEVYYNVEQQYLVLNKLYDYNKLSLFFVSLLWRANLSSHDLFSQVNIGEKHNAIIKKIMLDKDFSNIQNYSIIFMFNPTLLRGSIGMPLKRKFNGVVCYIFIVLGFFIIVKCDNQPFINDDHVMQENHPICIYLDYSDYISKLFKNATKNKTRHKFNL